MGSDVLEERADSVFRLTLFGSAGFAGVAISLLSASWLGASALGSLNI